MLRVVILTFYLMFNNLYAIDFIRDENLDKHHILESIEMYNDDLYILTRKSFDINEKKGVAGLFLLKDGKFEEIDVYYFEDNLRKDIYLIGKPFIYTDSDENLYLTSDAIYKYNGVSWTKMDFGIFSENTEVTRFSFDIYGNMWFILTNKEENNFSSTLYKYDGNNLKEIFKRPYPLVLDNGLKVKTGIEPLKNGNIAIQRYWTDGEEDFDKYDQEDLWIFDQDGKLLHTELIQLSGGLPFYEEYGVKSSNHINKKISDIYEDSKGNIYISTMAKILMREVEGEFSNINCCQGLSRYNVNNDSWKIFNKEDGLVEKENYEGYEQYNPVYAVTELSDGRILFTSSDGFYLINKNDKIVEVDPEMLLENGKMIVIGDELYDEVTFGFRVGIFFNSEYDPPPLNQVGFSQIQKDTKGNFYFFYNHAIFIINENHFLLSSVEDKIENEIVIYPNPSNQNIKIAGITPNSNFKIFNLLGETQIEGQYNGEINISKLISGHYYIQVINSNEIKNIKFIKN